MVTKEDCVIPAASSLSTTFTKEDLHMRIKDKDHLLVGMQVLWDEFYETASEKSVASVEGAWKSIGRDLMTTCRIHCRKKIIPKQPATGPGTTTTKKEEVKPQEIKKSNPKPDRKQDPDPAQTDPDSDVESNWSLSSEEEEIKPMKNASLDPDDIDQVLMMERIEEIAVRALPVISPTTFVPDSTTLKGLRKLSYLTHVQQLNLASDYLSHDSSAITCLGECSEYTENDYIVCDRYLNTVRGHYIARHHPCSVGGDTDGTDGTNKVNTNTNGNAKGKVNTKVEADEVQDSHEHHHKHHHHHRPYEAVLRWSTGIFSKVVKLNSEAGDRVDLSMPVSMCGSVYCTLVCFYCVLVYFGIFWCVLDMFLLYSC